MSVADLLVRQLRRDAARPLVTSYDDSTGERVELSVATAANWAAKVANLLVEDYGTEPGDEIGVLLPLHWETAMVLLGVWTAGACVVAGEPGWVTFHQAGSQGGADGRSVPMSLGPLGMDFARTVAASADDFAGTVDPDLPALRVGERTWIHRALADAAMHAAAEHGLDRSIRVLTVLGYDSVDGLDAGLLLPLAAGGSVVVVRSADQSLLVKRCEVERVTHTAGVTVGGLSRLA